MTAAAYEAVGWSYRRLEPSDPVSAANLRWPAGYRHPRNGSRPRLTASVLEAFTRARPLIEGVEAVGDPIEVLPCVFHALWHSRLSVSLDEPLPEHVLVRMSVAGAEGTTALWGGGANGARRGGRWSRWGLGARVRFRGARRQVVGLSGQCCVLVGENGVDKVVLAGFLFTDPDFAVLGAEVRVAGGAAVGLPA
ncbi:TnsA-like heteromeric transposase endonuclease subunit [Embleya sp. NPDC127516]|uniref:TnsA-like heteromeric transposase endonuclease subunit n=1 Tax=Embleya sp. NPDC127516 TaxID=3363990 RepID=UPI00382C7F65